MKIRRRNKTHAKGEKTGSKKLRSKFELLRLEIKDHVRKQHNLYVNNLVISSKSLLTRMTSPKNGLLQIYDRCSHVIIEHIVCSNIMAHLDEYKL